MKNVLLFVFFIVVCGYADRPRFDNEDDDKSKFDNDDYKNTKDSNGFFGKKRFGIKTGVGFSWLTITKKSFMPMSIEFGGVTNIQLSETIIGTSLFEIELNFYGCNDYEIKEFDDSKGRDNGGLRIPLLLQFMPYNRIVLEAGIFFDLLATENPKHMQDTDPVGFVSGVGFVMEKFIIGSRIYYRGGFDDEITVNILNVTYLF
jgi:hypothetical protein